jgi:DNA-binding response OmpR family regulator
MTGNMTTPQVRNAAAAQILIVDDDVYLAKLLERRLAAEGYMPSVSHDGKSALEMVEKKNFDLAVLDLNLPDMDGLSVLRSVRPDKPKLPVIVLTGRGRVEDRVMSLDQGADDCLVKPFSLMELSARIRALLRRNAEPLGSVLQVADLVLDREQFRVERGGKKLEFTVTEFKLLEYLMRSAGRVVTRAELMESIWKQAYDPGSNLVDVYVKYVRDKLDANSELKLIRTIRGLGYMIAID